MKDWIDLEATEPGSAGLGIQCPNHLFIGLYGYGYSYEKIFVSFMQI